MGIKATRSIDVNQSEGSSKHLHDEFMFSNKTNIMYAIVRWHKHMFYYK